MQVSGSGVQLNTPHWLPPAANPPETVQRVWFGFLFLWGFFVCFFVLFSFFFFFVVPMGEGILLFCFMGILVVCLLLICLGEGGQEGASRSLQLRG